MQYRRDNTPGGTYFFTVVMPDHIHTLWTLPEGDSDYSTRWRNIQRGFTAKVPAEERPED